jgi:hypothetical protein
MIIFVRDLLHMRIFALREKMLFLTFFTGACSVATQTFGKICTIIFIRKTSDFFTFFPRNVLRYRKHCIWIRIKLSHCIRIQQG